MSCSTMGKITSKTLVDGSGSPRRPGIAGFLADKWVRVSVDSDNRYIGLEPQPIALPIVDLLPSIVGGHTSIDDIVPARSIGIEQDF